MTTASRTLRASEKLALQVESPRGTKQVAPKLAQPSTNTVVARLPALVAVAALVACGHVSKRNDANSSAGGPAASGGASSTGGSGVVTEPPVCSQSSPPEVPLRALGESELRNELALFGQSLDVGGRSLLDDSVVLFGSHLQNPATHVKTDMPFLLAGGGGGLQGGRALAYQGQSHNDLLVSILNLFGDPRTTFGDARFCSGALSGV